ncbi:MAG TPA: hypothetical protein VGE45_01485 [Chloroflexia bacterium]|jgi:hypothetical protein
MNVQRTGGSTGTTGTDEKEDDESWDKLERDSEDTVTSISPNKRRMVGFGMKVKSKKGGDILPEQWKTKVEWGPLDPVGGWGTRMVAHTLGPDHPHGTEAVAKEGASYLFNHLREDVRGGYVQGHLLNDNLGGSGTDPHNLAPITNTANMEHNKRVEEPIKHAVDNHKRWVYYEVEVIPGRTTNEKGLGLKDKQISEGGKISLKPRPDMKKGTNYLYKDEDDDEEEDKNILDRKGGWLEALFPKGLYTKWYFLKQDGSPAGDVHEDIIESTHTFSSESTYAKLKETDKSWRDWVKEHPPVGDRYPVGKEKEEPIDAKKKQHSVYIKGSSHYPSTPVGEGEATEVPLEAVKAPRHALTEDKRFQKGGIWVPERKVNTREVWDPLWKLKASSREKKKRQEAQKLETETIKNKVTERKRKAKVSVDEETESDPKKLRLDEHVVEEGDVGSDKKIDTPENTEITEREMYELDLVDLYGGEYSQGENDPNW